jgi:hypothetical protein
VNVLAPEPGEEPDPPDDNGTTAVYDPESPTVPFSCVCSVSGPRDTAAVPVAYTLVVVVAGFGA